MSNFALVSRTARAMLSFSALAVTFATLLIRILMSSAAAK
jgi:hypothetical protein